MNYALVAALLLLPGFARATDCFSAAAQRYQVNVELLRSIADVESGMRPGAIGVPLSNGNVALGLMQINTIHLRDLSAYGISRAHLFDPCISAALGAWVLAGCIRDVGNTWHAVGCYNTGARSKNYGAQKRYVNKVAKRFYARTKHSQVSELTLAMADVQKREVTTPAPTRRMVVWSADE